MWRVGVPEYRASFDVPQAERLLWRAGFGPRRGEAEKLAKLGLDRAVHSLVAPGPDVYKAEVPGYLPGQLGEVPYFATKLTQAIAQPWVVLSNGVAAADFPEAVRLSCNGGASGFLAGRAIWADAAAQADPFDLRRRCGSRRRA